MKARKSNQARISSAFPMGSENPIVDNIIAKTGMSSLLTRWLSKNRVCRYLLPNHASNFRLPGFLLSTVLFAAVALSLLALDGFILSRAAQAKPCVGCKNKQTGLDPYSSDPQGAYNPLGNQPLTGGTSSTTLQGGAGNTTLQVGTGNTTLQMGTEQTMLQTGTQSTLLQANVEREGAPANILFLVDSSQSMKEKISVGFESGKEPKMEAAKRVLQEAISKIPGDVNIGLRVFGNGFTGFDTDCQQSALLVPIGKNNRRAIIESARGMLPFGLTPLTFGLMQAENDLRYVHGPKTVILISDGAETCGGDPCAYIDRLSRMGVKMKVDIVGLGLRRDREAVDQLNCIAQKSGGKYYDANTSADLINGITDSVKHAISGKVLTKITSPKITDTIPSDLAPIIKPGDAKAPPK